ncbi:MAG: lipopolysaccharide kinase InaA family protein [Phycisphaerales bacterium]
MSWHVIGNCDLPDLLSEGLVNAPDDFISQYAQPIKDVEGDRTTIVRYQQDHLDLCIKRFNLKDVLHTGVHAVMRSRAMWNRQNALRVTFAGVATPHVRAVLEERLMGPLRARSIVVTDWIDAEPMNRWLESEAARSMNESARVALMQQIAQSLLALRHARLEHGDMKWMNILIDRSTEPWLIDLDGMRHRWPWRNPEADIQRFQRDLAGHPDWQKMFVECTEYNGDAAHSPREGIAL